MNTLPVTVRLTVRLTVGMQCYLQQLLADGLDGASLEEVCERLICAALQSRIGGHKNKLLHSPSAWTHLEFVTGAAATAFRVPYDDVMGRGREAGVVQARHVAIFAAMQSKRYSCAKVGQFFKLDHSSVLHAVNKIRDHMRHDDELRQAVEQIATAACCA